jgi:hypothetical protein
MSDLELILGSGRLPCQREPNPAPMLLEAAERMIAAWESGLDALTEAVEISDLRRAVQAAKERQYVVYATPCGMTGSHRYSVPAYLESAQRTAGELRLCGRTDVVIVPVLQ